MSLKLSIYTVSNVKYSGEYFFSVHKFKFLRISPLYLSSSEGIRDIFLFQDIIKRGMEKMVPSPGQFASCSVLLGFDSFGFAVVPWVN